MLKALALLLLGVLLYAGYAVFRRRLRARRKSPRALFARLVRLTHDPAVAKRLVKRARERFPKLSEGALLERVIKQLERDRGR